MRLAPFVLLAEIGRKLLSGEAGWSAYQPLVIATLVLYGAAAFFSSMLLLWLHVVDADSAAICAAR